MKKKQEILQKVKDYLYESPLSPPPMIDVKKKEKFSPKPRMEEVEALLVKDEAILPQKILEKSPSHIPVSPHMSEWETLRTRALACHLCGLARSRTQVVFGSGRPDSMLYIVGEAPGMDEDIQGAPFVGRSGQLLAKMLLAIGIERDDVFITNIVKCRPPSNRDPLPEEIESCSPYLKSQIQLGGPKVILALGRYSGIFLVGGNSKASLSSLRSQFHDSSYGRVFVTYHPAAVLRSPTQRRPEVWEDLKILAKYLYNEGFYKTPEKKQILFQHQIITEQEL